VARAKSSVGAQQMPDVEVVVLSPLKRGGKRHEPDAVLMLPVDEAAQLVEAGVVRGKAQAQAQARAEADTAAAAGEDLSQSA